MRKRIDVIKAVRARDALKAELQQEQQQQKTDPQPAPVASASAKPAAPPSRRSSSFATLLVRTVLALLFILAFVYGVNEAMLLLLK